ncbi:hypothetical protein [Fusobacterium polymorphum]|jgi:hypothetical protein|uniref:hypothetical protein n=1 Tax=Fusobacterium nucleatum subsp. polymorphum TaxID=76857 RepID=UPI00205B22E2|nr:MAG TPA: hypothetical protein [Caudoviricetes sp.]
MENKEKKLMSLVLDLEEKLIKLEELKSMMLALEEAIFYAKNWSVDSYRGLVEHMFKFTHSIQNELKENFYNLKEKASINSDSDQAKN